MPTVAPPRRRKTPSPKTEEPVVVPDDGLGNGLGWDSQVILFNDDVNTFEHVIRCLVSVFGHGEQLATKIAVEAHVRGRAIAEVELHKAGFAHSAEAWAGGELVGGLYGVSVRGVFCGESMFSLATDASKCAFATLAPKLFAAGCPMVDCQTRSDHMERFGAAFMPRAEYLRRLSAAVRRGEETDWSRLST